MSVTALAYLIHWASSVHPEPNRSKKRKGLRPLFLLHWFKRHDINALKNNGSIPEGYTVNHYLTDTNAWFLCTDVPNGLKHFIRTPLSTGMDGDFDTGNVRYKARERYSFGVSDPLGVFGSPGA